MIKCESPKNCWVIGLGCFYREDHIVCDILWADKKASSVIEVGGELYSRPNTFSGVTFDATLTKL